MVECWDRPYYDGSIRAQPSSQALGAQTVLMWVTVTFVNFAACMGCCLDPQSSSGRASSPGAPTPASVLLPQPGQLPSTNFGKRSCQSCRRGHATTLTTVFLLERNPCSCCPTLSFCWCRQKEEEQGTQTWHGTCLFSAQVSSLEKTLL